MGFGGLGGGFDSCGQVVHGRGGATQLCGINKYSNGLWTG